MPHLKIRNNVRVTSVGRQEGVQSLVNSPDGPKLRNIGISYSQLQKIEIDGNTQMWKTPQKGTVKKTLEEILKRQSSLVNFESSESNGKMATILNLKKGFDTQDKNSSSLSSNCNTPEAAGRPRLLSDGLTHEEALKLPKRRSLPSPYAQQKLNLEKFQQNSYGFLPNLNSEPSSGTLKKGRRGSQLLKAKSQEIEEIIDPKRAADKKPPLYVANNSRMEQSANANKNLLVFKPASPKCEELTKRIATVLKKADRRYTIHRTLFPSLTHIPHLDRRGSLTAMLSKEGNGSRKVLMNTNDIGKFISKDVDSSSGSVEELKPLFELESSISMNEESVESNASTLTFNPANQSTETAVTFRNIHSVDQAEPFSFKDRLPLTENPEITANEANTKANEMSRKTKSVQNSPVKTPKPVVFYANENKEEEEFSFGTFRITQMHH